MPVLMLLISSSIVAVHSPNRNPIQSFTSTANGKFWLGDEDMLPRDIPNCRILVYNHGGSGSIMGAAMELVESLVHNRRVRAKYFVQREPVLTNAMHSVRE